MTYYENIKFGGPDYKASRAAYDPRAIVCAPLSSELQSQGFELIEGAKRPNSINSIEVIDGLSEFGTGVGGGGSFIFKVQGPYVW